MITYEARIPETGERVAFRPKERDGGDPRIAPYWRNGVLDFDLAGTKTATAEHYGLQWGKKVGFQEFTRVNAEAAAVMPGMQMGWRDLFTRIRDAADRQPLSVLDAGCGFGGVMDQLFRAPAPKHLIYVGADIHEGLHDIERPSGIAPEQIVFLRWDISDPVPFTAPFDAVICRATIHHTPDPPRTFASLASALGPDGLLAISVYAKKGRLRELVDDALRAQFGALPADQAFEAAREFTTLGRALREIKEKLSIPEDLPWLGIEAGTYNVQEFIYDHVVKCWHNGKFGDRFSDVVNFDWYHPPFAFRYELDELVAWFEKYGIAVSATKSIKAQHYIEGIRDRGI